MKIKVSKTQQKKIKINAENCQWVQRLQSAGYIEEPKEIGALILKELNSFGVFYQCIYKLREN